MTSTLNSLGADDGLMGTHFHVEEEADDGKCGDGGVRCATAMAESGRAARPKGLREAGGICAARRRAPPRSLRKAAALWDFCIEIGTSLVRISEHGGGRRGKVAESW